MDCEKGNRMTPIEKIERAKNLAARAASEVYATTLNVELQKLFANDDPTTLPPPKALEGIHVHEFAVFTGGPTYLVRTVWAVTADDRLLAAAIEHAKRES
jgi:hypothetical protein